MGTTDAAASFYGYFSGAAGIRDRHPEPGGNSRAFCFSSGSGDEDPALVELAAAALRLPTGSALVQLSSGVRHLLRPIASPLGALLGLRCPPGGEAVATCLDSTVHRAGHPPESGRVAVAVGRRGDSAVRWRRTGSDHAEAMGPADGPLYDMAMRALGLDTEQCADPVVWFPDGVFLCSLTELLAAPHSRRGPRARHPLTWDLISADHPLSAGRPRVTPGQLRELRADFQSRWSWGSLRQRVVRQPAWAPEPLPGLTPAIATWLDDGSFARWVLSQFSYVPQARELVLEALEPGLAKQLDHALGGLS